MEQTIPRPEYPRPQFERLEWKNLNGLWSFSFDFGRSGLERGYASATGFSDKILVPFCPECELSGVGYRDFIETIWYHRKLFVPPEWHEQRILIHFGAVDFEAEVYIDGKPVGRHWGGSSSFSFDITPFVTPGQMHDLVVHVNDQLRSGVQTGGKQSVDYASAGCFYTRTTGIWQTVWIEAVSPLGLCSCAMVPDVDSNALVLTPQFFKVRSGYRFRVRIFDRGEQVAEQIKPAVNGLPYRIPIPTPKLWSPDHPFLYDLQLDVINENDQLQDSVKSYAGMRKIHLEGNQIYLNNEPIYLRMVLDQGFYKQGLWTAPADDDLKRDIELGIEAGFNGARLHQKVFEERFHYWADRLGYLTWGESPSWGLNVKSDVAARNFLSEWREVVVRDRSHPSIIAWTTLNETWDISDGRQHRRLHLEAYDLTRALDPARPINNASGGCHVRTDLYTVHIYEQDPDKLHAKLNPEELGGVFRTLGDKEARYEGQPYIIDEFGGIKWIADEARLERTSWGYGQAPLTLEEFFRRLDGQVGAILKLSHAAGYCYTQLTDVEQEQNGIYHYDRSPKFDIERIRRIFSKTNHVM